MRPFSSRLADFSFEDAYQIAKCARDVRVANGEVVLGRKIGFTNRTVWSGHGLSAPIWGYLYDRTVHHLPLASPFDVSGLAEPRIEPEIVFKLVRAPHPDMNDDALLECVAWIAQGFEIVQSIFPGWLFKPADAIAAQGVHVALLIGEQHPVSSDRRRWSEALVNFRIDLLQDGKVMASGQGCDVLGGPIQALRFLVQELTRFPAAEALQSGEIVTTGTLTQAMPAGSSETWSTALTGIDIAGLQVRFA